MFHYFNIKPWNQSRLTYPDLEAWWQLVTRLLQNSSLEVQGLLQPIFNAQDLNLKRVICGYCNITKKPESVWKSHGVFDTNSGAIVCPNLV